MRKVMAIAAVPGLYRGYLHFCRKLLWTHYGEIRRESVSPTFGHLRPWQFPGAVERGPKGLTRFVGTAFGYSAVCILFLCLL